MKKLHDMRKEYDMMMVDPPKTTEELVKLTALDDQIRQNKNSAIEMATRATDTMVLGGPMDTNEFTDTRKFDDGMNFERGLLNWKKRFLDLMPSYYGDAAIYNNKFTDGVGYGGKGPLYGNNVTDYWNSKENPYALYDNFRAKGDYTSLSINATANPNRIPSNYFKYNKPLPTPLVKPE